MSNFRRLRLRLCQIALVANLALLLWYLVRGYRYIIHADSASRVLLAREIFDTGRLFPPDWVYVNGDLLTFSAHLAVLPFLYFLPAGFVVYALSSVLFSALVLYGVWLVTEILSCSLERRLLLVAVVAGGLSTITAEFIFGQLTYGVVLGFCCYLVYFTYKVAIWEETKHRRAFACLLLVTIFLATASNPNRAVVYYLVPLFAAILFRGVLARHGEGGLPHSKKGILVAAAVSAVGAVAGAIFYSLVFPGLVNVQGVAQARWLSPPSMVRNLGLLWTQYLAVFGAAPPVDEPVVSVQGLYWAGKLVIAGLLLWLIAGGYRGQMKRGLSGGAFVAVFAGCLGLTTLFFQLTTTVPDVSDVAGGSRYMMPAAILLLLIGLAYRLDFKRNPILSSIAVLAAVAYVCTSWISLYSNVASVENRERFRKLASLQKFLLDNDLHYGYAYYWNAAPLSVLSNEQLRVRQITVLNGLPIPAPWISSLRWYSQAAWKNSTFMLLTVEQTKLFDWKAMADRGAIPSRQLKFEGFDIYVFDENLAAKGLPNWADPRQLLSK